MVLNAAQIWLYGSNVFDPSGIQNITEESILEQSCSPHAAQNQKEEKGGGKKFEKGREE